MAKKNKLSSALLLGATVVAATIGLASCTEAGKDTSKPTTPSVEPSVEPTDPSKPTEAPTPTPDKPVVPVELSVQFMIPKAQGSKEFALYDTKKVDSEGRLQLPKDPKLEGYTFRAWYLDKEFKNKFDPKTYKFTESIQVYGLFIEDTVKVHLIDEKGEDTVIDDSKLPNLSELEEAQNALAASKNLVFDGWYTNKDCTTPYTPESEAIEIYGRYMAEVSFNNGYENVATALVKPGDVVVMPTPEDIVAKFDYMSAEDMFFVDSEGNDYKPANKVTENTEIKVLWKTPFLSYDLIEGTNNYVCKVDGSSLKDNRAKLEAFPVISVPAKVTINGELVSVKSVYGSQFTIAKAATKLIVNEGIESFYAYTDTMGGCALKEVVLPHSLRIIENAFYGFKNLEKLELHEGLEVVYDSFWGKTSFGQHTTEEAYPFITIPASVTNMVQVPCNLKLAEGSPFYYEDGNLYKDDASLGKVLAVAGKANVNAGKIIVPEGVDAIQVGAFDGLSGIKNIQLPESFTKISYNNDSKNYKGLYIGKRLTNYETVNKNPAADTTMNTSAYSIISNLESLEYISFNSQSYPKGMSEYAFNDRGKPYTKLNKTHLVFIKEVSEGDVEVSVNIAAPTLDYYDKATIKLPTNTVITEDELLKRIGITQKDLQIKIRVVSLDQFGQKFDFSKPITRNTYLDLEFESGTAGFTYELDPKNNKLAYVTGFDVATADELPDGGYAINIPSEYEGKRIVGIKDSAFEGNTNIVTVNIAAGIKTIGARAFYGCSFLKSVNIREGGLESIGAEAFKYAGCINKGTEDAPAWEVNPQIAEPDTKHPGQLLAPETKIVFPVSNLKVKTIKEEDSTRVIEAIGEEAFNSPAIRSFYPLQEEAAITLAGSNFFGIKLTDSIKYAFIKDNYSPAIYGLVRIDKQEAIGNTDAANAKPGLWSGSFIASAAGAPVESYALGQTIGMQASIDILQVTVKKGSIAIYDENVKHIAFGAVKEIEAGAFVYVNKKLLEVTEKEAPTEDNPANKILISKAEYPQSDKNNMFGLNCEYYLTKEQITTQDPKIFKEGWISGFTKEEVSRFLEGAQMGSSFIGK